MKEFSYWATEEEAVVQEFIGLVRVQNANQLLLNS